MASTTTQTTIFNRALQLVGYQAISSIQSNDRGAKAMNRAWDPVLEQELRANFWNFTIQRAILPASAITPAFGKNFYYPLPGDFLEIAPPDQYCNYSYGYSGNTPNAEIFNDWQIEQMPNNGGLAIASNDSGPINLRYTSNNVTPSGFDPIFSEALACSLAINTCEELTQSNTKIQTLNSIYKEIMGRAKKRNAFDSKPVLPPVDSYIRVRL